jgi:hypothetical protein
MTLRDSLTSPPPLTRRNVLAALGTVGVLGVGAGLGSGASFSDVEELAGGTDGGLVDLRIDYRTEFEGAVREVPSNREGLDCASTGLVDGDAAPLFDLASIDPGDAGSAEFCLHVCDNRSYLWLQGCVHETTENGQTLPEAQVDGTSGENEGELQDYLDVELWYDHDGDGERDADEGYVYRGSLAGLDAVACRGLPLDGVGFLPGDETAACTDLVKLEDLDGELFGTYEYPDGDSAAADPVPYATYDPDASDGDGHVYSVVGPDGDEVDLRFHDYQFENGDLVGVRLTVLPDDDPETTGYGLCRVVVKSGGGPDVVAEYAPDCTRSELVYSPRSDRTNVDRQEISYVAVSVCERQETPETPETSCFDPGRYCLGLSWSLSADAENVDAVQGDGVRFSLTFGAVQCRHNEGNRNPFAGDGGGVT